MTTDTARHGEGSWLHGLKRIVTRLVHGTPPVPREAPGPHAEPDRPITSEEMVDESSEDSFPASDPPSYTGTTL